MSTATGVENARATRSTAVFDTAGTVIDPAQGIRIFLYVTARSFDGLLAQRGLVRIDRKLTHHSGSSGPPAPPCINAALDDEAAA